MPVLPSGHKCRMQACMHALMQARLRKGILLHGGILARSYGEWRYPCSYRQWHLPEW